MLAQFIETELKAERKKAPGAVVGAPTVVNTTPDVTTGWSWPTQSARITTQPGAGHVAFDVGATTQGREGDPVWSPVAGAVVEQVLWQPDGYGLNVRLRAPGGEEIILAHLRGVAPGVKPGTKLTQGELVGLMGSTGRSTGAHLHFEVRNASGGKIDPASLFPGGANPPAGAPGKLPPISTFQLANPQPLVPDEQVREDLRPGNSISLPAPLQSIRESAQAAVAGNDDPVPPGFVQIASTPFGPIRVPTPGNLAKSYLILSIGSLIVLISLAVLLYRGAGRALRSPVVDVATDFVPGVSQAKAVKKVIGAGKRLT